MLKEDTNMIPDEIVAQALLNLSGAKFDEEVEKQEIAKTITPPIAPMSMQMKRAMEIVHRYRMRGNVLPHQLADRRNDPLLEQEHLDAQKLSKWRQSVRGK